MTSKSRAKRARVADKHLREAGRWWGQALYRDSGSTLYPPPMLQHHQGFEMASADERREIMLQVKALAGQFLIDSGLPRDKVLQVLEGKDYLD